MDRTFLAQVSFQLDEAGRRDCLRNDGNGRREQTRAVEINDAQLDYFSVDANGVIYAGIPDQFSYWPDDYQLLFCINPELLDAEATEAACGCGSCIAQEQVSEILKGFADGEPSVSALIERVSQIPGMTIAEIRPGMIVGTYEGPGNEMEVLENLLGSVLVAGELPC